MKIKCYACNALASGTRDRYYEAEGNRVPACKRHQDSTRSILDCIYCGCKVSSKGITIDGEYAHKKCHNENCKGL